MSKTPATPRALRVGVGIGQTAAERGLFSVHLRFSQHFPTDQLVSQLHDVIDQLPACVAVYRHGGDIKIHVTDLTKWVRGLPELLVSHMQTILGEPIEVYYPDRAQVLSHFADLSVLEKAALIADWLDNDDDIAATVLTLRDREGSIAMFIAAAAAVKRR